MVRLATSKKNKTSTINPISALTTYCMLIIAIP